MEWSSQVKSSSRSSYHEAKRESDTPQYRSTKGHDHFHSHRGSYHPSGGRNYSRHQDGRRDSRGEHTGGYRGRGGHRGHYRGGGRDYRYNASPEDRIRQILVRLGDKQRERHTACKMAAEALEYALIGSDLHNMRLPAGHRKTPPPYRDVLLAQLLAVMKRLPVKTSICATLVALWGNMQTQLQPGEIPDAKLESMDTIDLTENEQMTAMAVDDIPDDEEPIQTSPRTEVVQLGDEDDEEASGGGAFEEDLVEALVKAEEVIVHGTVRGSNDPTEIPHTKSEQQAADQIKKQEFAADHHHLPGESAAAKKEEDDKVLITVRAMRRREINICLRTLVQRIHFELDTLLRSTIAPPRQVFWETVNLLRATADLANVGIVECRSLFCILKQLVDMAIELQGDEKNRQEKLSSEADVLLLMVMLVLPWVGQARCESEKEHFGGVWEGLRSAVTEGRSVCGRAQAAAAHPWMNESPPADHIEQAWEALTTMRADSWTNKAVFKLHQLPAISSDIAPHANSPCFVLMPLTASKEEVTRALGELHRKPTSGRVRPGNQLVEGVGLLSRRLGIVRFDTPILGMSWAKELFPIVASLKPHEIWCLTSLFHSTVVCFHDNINLCTEKLLSIPLAHDHFEIHLADTIFAGCLALPEAEEHCVFYARVFQRMCTLQNSIRSHVDEAIRRLSLKLANLDQCCFERFASFTANWWTMISAEADPVSPSIPSKPDSVLIAKSFVNVGSWFISIDLKSIEKKEEQKLDEIKAAAYAGCPVLNGGPRLHRYLLTVVELYARMVSPTIAKKRLPSQLLPYLRIADMIPVHPYLTAPPEATRSLLPMESTSAQEPFVKEEVPEDQSPGSQQSTLPKPFEVDVLSGIMLLRHKPNTIEHQKALTAVRAFFRLLREKGTLTEKPSEDAIQNFLYVKSGIGKKEEDIVPEVKRQAADVHQTFRTATDFESDSKDTAASAFEVKDEVLQGNDNEMVSAAEADGAPTATADQSNAGVRPSSNIDVKVLDEDEMGLEEEELDAEMYTAPDYYEAAWVQNFSSDSSKLPSVEDLLFLLIFVWLTIGSRSVYHMKRATELYGSLLKDFLPRVQSEGEEDTGDNVIAVKGDSILKLETITKASVLQKVVITEILLYWRLYTHRGLLVLTQVLRSELVDEHSVLAVVIDAIRHPEHKLEAFPFTATMHRKRATQMVPASLLSREIRDLALQRLHLRVLEAAFQLRATKRGNIGTRREEHGDTDDDNSSVEEKEDVDMVTQQRRALDKALEDMHEAVFEFVKAYIDAYVSGSRQNKGGESCEEQPEHSTCLMQALALIRTYAPITNSAQMKALLLGYAETLSGTWEQDLLMRMMSIVDLHLDMTLHIEDFLL